MKRDKENGFEYHLESQKIEEYSKWPAEDKLRWLSEFNKLRSYYPQKIIETQEKYRRGEN